MARVQQKAFTTCTADFHYVTGLFPVPSLWRRRRCRSGRFRGRRERPPDFWSWFGRGAVAVVHSSAPPSGGVAPVQRCPAGRLSFFHADRGTVPAAGSTISFESIGTALAAMCNQKGLDDELFCVFANICHVATINTAQVGPCTFLSDFAPLHSQSRAGRSREICCPRPTSCRACRDRCDSHTDSGYRDWCGGMLQSAIILAMQPRSGSASPARQAGSPDRPR